MVETLAPGSEGLLHNGLRLLGTQVDGGLEDDPQAAAVLAPHAVAPPLPARLLQQLGRLVEVELPARIGRLKLRGGIEDVAGELAGSGEFEDGAPIDSQRKGLPHPQVGEEGMRHLDATALAVHLRPGVRAIELNEGEHRARGDVKRVLAPLVCQPLPDVLVHRLHSPGEVELAGLGHRPSGRGGIPPFSSTVSKTGRLGT
jgi:hypothetical protein